MKILHILAALDGGGVEALLYNYYSKIDRDKVHFDFVVYDENIGMLEKTFLKMGSKVYHVTPKTDNLRKSMLQTIEVMKKGSYDIVHCHAGATGFFALYCAKVCKVKYRILHNHVAFEPETLAQRIKRKMFTILAKYYSTHWFACGIDAGKWLFGQQSYKKGKVYILNNAIDINKFTYCKSKRDKLRCFFDIQDKFVVGNVARFSYQKNHEFLIKIFAEIYKKNSNSILLLIGRGELEFEVKKQVNELGLSNAVKFLGIRNDVPDLLSAIDVFILPSRFEGLPVTLVETQAAGMQSFVSDAITKEIRVSDLLNYISIDDSPEKWAEVITENYNQYSHKDVSQKIRLGGYDIDIEAKKLEKFYLSCT